jgi:hypothetical protein
MFQCYCSDAPRWHKKNKKKVGEGMQISNLQANQRFQSVQAQTKGVEGSASEEANESSSERAAEAQKKAIAQSTGVGVNLDTKI